MPRVRSSFLAQKIVCLLGLPVEIGENVVFYNTVNLLHIFVIFLFKFKPFLSALTTWISMALLSVKEARCCYSVR